MFFLIDHIRFDFIVMHYGIGWRKRLRVFPQDFLLHEHFNNTFFRLKIRHILEKEAHPQHEKRKFVNFAELIFGVKKCLNFAELIFDVKQ